MSDVEFEIIPEETPKKAGRKPKGEIPQEARAMDILAANEQEKELTAEKALELYGDGLPYERLRYMEETKSLFNLAKTSIIEAGKRLIIIKANEEHGGWLHTLEQIGMNPRYAQRAMYVTRKYGKYDKLSHLEQSKLDIFEDFTDPELEKLNDGDEVKGITLDAIDRMTAKESKAKIRELEKKIDAIEKVTEEKVRQKDKQIDDLLMKVELRVPLTKEQEAGNKLKEFRKEFMGALAGAVWEYERLNKLIIKMQEIENINVTQLDEFIKSFWDDMADLENERLAFEEDSKNIHPTWNKHTEE